VKAAKSQQIIPNDRKHLDPVGIGAHEDGSESAVLTASATACRGHFTAVYKRSAVGCETEDSRKNPYDVVAGRLTMSRRENLAIQPTRRAFARRRSLNLTSAGG
jgi:hypothetical protein